MPSREKLKQPGQPLAKGDVKNSPDFIGFAGASTVGNSQWAHFGFSTWIMDFLGW